MTNTEQLEIVKDKFYDVKYDCNIGKIETNMQGSLLSRVVLTSILLE